MNIRVLFVTIGLCLALRSNGEEHSCLLKGTFLEGMNKVLIAERHVFLSDYRKLCQMFELDKWLNLTEDPVCFGSVDDTFATVVVPFEGFLTSLKLVHVEGHVTCDQTTPEHITKWGCSENHPTLGKTPLNVVVTTDNRNHIIYPKKQVVTNKDSLWYTMAEGTPDSPQLIFKDSSDPHYIGAGNQLRIGYGEKLYDSEEEVIRGKVCVMLKGLFVH